MYRSKISSRVCIAPKFNDRSVRAVDTFESAGYTLNEFGHIRNDFSQLNEAQNTLEFQRALAKMQEIQAAQPDNSNKSFEELVREVRPRWCQTPAELDRFEQYLINTELDYYNKLQQKKSEAGATLDTDTSEVTNVAS